jgi:hypothetical protein
MRSLYACSLVAATLFGLTACGGSPPPTRVTVATPLPSLRRRRRSGCPDSG